MTARIYDRPDLDQRAARLALYISGAFPSAVPGLAYEGRLQVHNGIGGLSVEQIDGDQLPNGTSLYIAGSEIVLAWPPYSETDTVIPNPGFEDGDTGWSKGQGWSIGTENPIAGARSARYGENQGSSLIESAARYPVNQGRPITATCQVRQGASAEGNAGAAVQLQWRRADGSLLDTSEGNAVMSASKNRVYPSTVTAAPPAGSQLVNIASRGIRSRENKPLFIDSFTWDHQHLTGVNVERTFEISLRVRDSAGRSAVWRGQVRVLFGEVDAYWNNVVSVMNFDGVGADFHDGKGHPWDAQGGIVQVGGGITLSTDGQSIWSDGPFPDQSAMIDFTVEAFITVAGYNPSWGFVVNFAPGSTGLYISDSGRVGFYNGGVWVAEHVVPVAQKVHVCVERKDDIITAYLNGIGAGANFRNFPAVGVTQMGIGADQKINSFFRGIIHATRVTSGVARYGGNFEVPTDPFPERG